MRDLHEDTSDYWHKPLHGIPIASMTEGQAAQQQNGRQFHLWSLESPGDESDVWGRPTLEAFIMLTNQTQLLVPSVSQSEGTDNTWASLPSAVSLTNNNNYLFIGPLASQA